MKPCIAAGRFSRTIVESLRVLPSMLTGAPSSFSYCSTSAT